MTIDPPRFIPAPESLDPHSRRLRFVCAMDEAPVSEEQLLRARRAYYGAISYVDEQFARVVGTLRNCGLAEATIVILLSDHGEMLGEPAGGVSLSFTFARGDLGRGQSVRCSSFVAPAPDLPTIELRRLSLNPQDRSVPRL